MCIYDMHNIFIILCLITKLLVTQSFLTQPSPCEYYLQPNNMLLVIVLMVPLGLLHIRFLWWTVKVVPSGLVYIWFLWWSINQQFLFLHPQWIFPCRVNLHLILMMNYQPTTFYYYIPNGYFHISDAMQCLFLTKCWT